MRYLAATRRMNRLLENHFEAGHDLDHPKFVTDLRTMRHNIDQVLDTLGPPSSMDERIAFIVRELVRQRATHKELQNMADISGLQAAVDNLEASRASNFQTIVDAFADGAETMQDLKDQIAALSVGQLDQAAIDALTEKVNAADASFDAAAAAVVPVVTEPTPEPEPTPEEEV